MKLLLTSGGITNKTLAQALLDLMGKPANRINIAFIPTAANANRDHKGYFIDNLYQLKQQNYKMIDLVDISALPKWNWQERLEMADVWVVSGGDSNHLMRWVEESGLKELLPEFLKTKVWVGISAGSIITAPTLALGDRVKTVSYKERFGYEAKEGLNLVNFYFRPHLNSSTSLHSTKELIAEIAKQIPETIYGIDDQMAIKVVDGKEEVIGEGEYVVFNK
ncbi:hypothetical protein A3B85_00695 [Candidatus Nomurabacteria bacterium RIFCSPHIGHO2_02_FULL_37_13]|uniref:Peptidase S51 n=1 Tax=Candidatus Nomurabacteria bacterium RIFCSPHIGHO2_02_FULL_37_13 TaxID=1801750 RepID=A0A1F6W3Z1_9BACT|nr:MAG: hypothetical protein A2640_00555 [Candidatus Nomurabacteria bacterium RIFCSPHIGHO2_01_FULL_36_23]OGI76611.1 MAG: hypothetical protein A3B85_00695 [Candidatus Nomurabacteria bacterium RIFCSPHIGHO2_02_FULL_37_13]OGI88672.1 MAG: hypothetical protein A2906_03400 [Candidatus Nomurabacteria bacterium RIFCSPLOWO2_01_FULL_37_25]